MFELPLNDNSQQFGCADISRSFLNQLYPQDDVFHHPSEPQVSWLTKADDICTQAELLGKNIEIEYPISMNNFPDLSSSRKNKHFRDMDNVIGIEQSKPLTVSGLTATTLPTITVRASDATAAEVPSGQTANNGRFTLSRTGDISSALTVSYTLGGTATNGIDYSNLTGSVTFAAGSSTAVIDIRPIDDTNFEGSETAILRLNTGSNYTLGSANTATVTILDNDKPTITITVNDPTAAETSPGQPTNPGQFTLTRTGNTTQALTVNYTISGTATNGVDYSNLGGSVTFAAGSSTAIININAIDDTNFEGNETVTLTLAQNNNYVLGANITDTVTILDNDPVNSRPTLQSLVQGGTSLTDEGKSIAYDPRTGNYVVAGNSQVTNDYTSFDAWVILYNSQGQALWRHDFRTPDIPYSWANRGGGYYQDAVVSVAFDHHSNVILGGRSQFQGVYIQDIGDPNNPNDDVTKYIYNTDGWMQKINGTTGGLIWSQRFDYGLEDWADDITVDSQGNAYMVGYTNDGAFINKYNAADGTLAWSQRLGSSSTDHAQAVTVDNAGNVYVAGKYFMMETNQGISNSWLAKLDASGSVMWTQEIVATPLADEVADLAIDGSGNLYLTGKSVDYSAKTSDGWLLKLDNNGNQLWNYTSYGTSQQEHIFTNLVIDAQGNTYLSGEKVNNNGTSYVSSALLVKVDSTGNLLWEETLASPTGSTGAYDVALGNNGQIYLTGLTSGSLNGIPNAGAFDVFIARYSQS